MKYQVGGSVQGSTFIGEFEAGSPQEAIEKAYKKASVSVCHQCAEHIQDPEPCELWAEDEDGNVTHESEASHPAEVAAPPGEQWVPVGERLPEPGQWVLCHRPGHHMRMFSHTGWGWRKEDGSVPSHSLEYTHWRPLPAPPKGTP